MVHYRIVLTQGPRLRESLHRRRRIDLLTKLLAPLFVSLLTSTAGYSTSCVVLLTMSGVTACFELIWIGTVYRRFGALKMDEDRVASERLDGIELSEPVNGSENEITRRGQAGTQTLATVSKMRISGLQSKLRSWTKDQALDWRTFASMPIFASSITIALLYMSALSFDPQFIAYLKSETTYRFVALPLAKYRSPSPCPSVVADHAPRPGTSATPS